MDRLDAALFRELSRDRVLHMGTLDPRRSTEDLAKRLRVDRTTVRDRLKAWESCGFVMSYHAIPNLRLFGAVGWSFGIRVPDLRDKARVLEDLYLLDECFAHIDHVGEWMGVALLLDEGAAPDRAIARVKRIPGIAELARAFEFPIPECGVAPSALDWRIMREWRSNPRARLRDVARAVGASAATVTRRYDRLVRGQALWVIPALDFTKYTGAVAARLLAYVAKDGDPEAVARALAAAFPDLLQIAPHVGKGAPGVDVIDVYLHLPSVAEVEDVTVRALQVKSVAEAEVLFPRRYDIGRRWVDERVEAALKASRPLSAR